MIPTLFGISLICFALIQFVPGGPVEEAISRMRQVGAAKGMSSSRTITPEEVANIKAYFGFDQPAPVRYGRWLAKLVKGDLGTSYTYQEPVLRVILSKMPISLFFGLSSFFISYLVCIPLGMAKALRHNSLFDTLSSIGIFTGNVIPSYALGIVLIVFLGGGSYLNFFPISGIISEQHESLSFFGKLLDFLHHMVLPMVCYMLGQFAFLTMLMKNSLLEELGKDYIRTALVKGASLKIAVRKHALRNGLVPLATGAGEIFTLMFAGSIMIERVFDIDGMGLLLYNSTINRDYNVVLGLIVLMSGMALLGRLFADFLYVVVDPRIRLQ